MARGVNKVILIGNLGADPETRYTPQGAPITNINVATDESYKDKNTGQVVPKTEWHRVVLFNRLAEVAQQYLRKGSKVYIEGRLQTRKWQDQSGQDRYTTEIVGNEMQMLDSRQADGGPQQGGYPKAQNQGNQGYGYGQQEPHYQSHAAPQQQQAAPQQSPMQNAPRNHAQQQQQNYGQSRPQNSSAPAPVPADDFDDDIPF